MSLTERKIWAVFSMLEKIGTPPDPELARARHELAVALAALSDAYTDIVDELAAARGTYR